MKTPLLVLFDCDGTLINSVHIIHECMEQTFKAFNVTPPSESDTRTIIGLSLDHAIAHLLKTPIDARVVEMVVFYKQAYNKVRVNEGVQEPLYPNIEELLKTLAKMDHIILGIVTGKSRRGVQYICDAYHFDFFYVVRTADDCPSKPAPDMVLECCEQAGIKPENTYVVGDTTYDIEMAIKAGATPIGVEWGYHDREALEQAGALHIIQQPNEILSILRGFDARHIK